VFIAYLSPQEETINATTTVSQNWLSSLKKIILERKPLKKLSQQDIMTIMQYFPKNHLISFYPGSLGIMQLS